MVRGHTNNNLYLATFNGTAWTTFSKIAVAGLETRSAPALAATQDRLVCVFRVLDNTLCYVWHIYDRKSPWSPVHYFSSGSTAAAPALASHNGTLYCVHRS
jgi:hypothetical protein